MLNVFLTNDTLGPLSAEKYAVEPTPYRDINIEIIDIPITCQCAVKEDKLTLKLWYRDEINSRTRLYSEKEIKYGENLNAESEDISFIFVAAWKSVCSFLSKEGTLDAYCQLDDSTDGIYFVADGSKVNAARVIGKVRPAMQCVTAAGDVRMARPYMDEVMEMSRLEALPTEEKIRLAEEGNRDMMESLASLYLDGEDADPEKGIYWLTKLAELGVAEAQFNLGLYSAKGYGTPRDLNAAAAWMEKAAQKGDPDAGELAEEYRVMLSNEVLANQGDVDAMAQLAEGYMRLGGTLSQLGEEEDYARCIHWAKQAAAQNSGAGYWVLALAYEHGRGVAESVEEALACYEKAASLDHAASLHSLGCYYLRGDKVEKDQEKGLQMAIRSAEMGYGPAMRTVGGCYQFGHGTAADLAAAIKWYEKAGEAMDDDEMRQKAMVLDMFRKGELPEA